VGGVIRIGVLGAGAVGAYLGGRLLAAGADVILVGRLGLTELTTVDDAGVRRHVARLRYADDPAALADREVVLVTVKSTDSERAAELLARVAPAATAISFQNGVSNPTILRRHLGRVVAGMVPFNVIREGSVFRQTTSGTLAVERAAGEAFLAALRATSLPLEVHDDLTRLAWSKLLLNLNNSVNALAGVPLAAQLGERGYRRVVARAVGEGLRCLRAAGVRPVRVGRVPPQLLPVLLRAPDALFRRLAGALVKIDPEASSSMQDDLRRGRPTEIDFLNGEIIRLGQAHGVATPVNARIRELVGAAEAAGRGSPRLTAAALLAATRA
jgi:2-dehydropantoate 2-reductase